MKLLIIAYYFAPSTGPNAKRPLYFTKGFLDAGWDVDVVCSYRLVPPGSPAPLTHPRLRLLRIEDPVEKAERALSGRAGRILTSMIRGLLWPDSFVLWSLRVLHRLKFTDYDRILITINPISPLILLLGRKTARRTVVDYQDIASPDTLILGKAPLWRAMLPLLTVLQRSILRRTMKTIFATQSYLDEYVKHGLVDPSKAEHIPFFYDDTAFKKTEPPEDRFVISYLGQFGQKKGIRSPEIFLEALSLFLARNPEARTSTVFAFYGPWISEHTTIVNAFGLQDVVRINPPVPYERYIELLSEANVLLLVASREQNFFVPSKLLDYFGAKRPVLGFVPPDSETYSILKKAGMARYVSDEADVEGGVRSLEELWRARQDDCATRASASTEQWSASFQVPRVVQVLSGPEYS